MTETRRSIFLSSLDPTEVGFLFGIDFPQTANRARHALAGVVVCDMEKPPRFGLTRY